MSPVCLVGCYHSPICLIVVTYMIPPGIDCSPYEIYKARFDSTFLWSFCLPKKEQNNIVFISPAIARSSYSLYVQHFLGCL